MASVVEIDAGFEEALSASSMELEMSRLHISQDDTGFWQLSFEDDDGTLTLISHQFPSPDHLIEDARELVAKGKVPGATLIIAPPRQPHLTAREAPRPYSKPKLRKAVE